MRPIDADALLDKLLPIAFGLEHEYGSLGGAVSGVMRHIEAAPTIDVAPVRHGQWVQVICHEEFEDGFVDRVKECCSVCHAPNWQRTTNYCPNCGAKMDGGAGNGC